MWTVSLIKYHLENQQGIKASLDTVERALKDLGYSYKRLTKGVSERTPSKAEKIEALGKMIKDVSELVKQKDCQIFILDESHISSEPYLIKGWQKKDGRLRIPCPVNRERLTLFGCLNLRSKRFY